MPTQLATMMLSLVDDGQHVLTTNLENRLPCWLFLPLVVVGMEEIPDHAYDVIKGFHNVFVGHLGVDRTVAMTMVTGEAGFAWCGSICGLVFVR